MTPRLNTVEDHEAPAFSRSGERVEIRFELTPGDVDVLDGYCQASGATRTDVFKRLLKEWSDQKLHEAILVCRVARVNPAAPESGRKGAA